MRALITGITGFVGRHLLKHLVDCGDQVVGISESGTWPLTLHHDVSSLAKLEQIDLTIADDEALIDFLKRKQPHAIYHLAAQANPSKSLVDPRGTWAINLGGTLNLLEAIRLSGLRPRVILVSSGVCYGNPDRTCIPVSERCPLQPNNPYAASKIAADFLGIQHARSYGTEVIIARPFNHYGPGQPEDYVISSLAKQIVEIGLGKRTTVSHGNLAVVRDFTDVRDVVRAYRLLVLHGHPGEVYNIGTGRDISILEMLQQMLACVEYPVTLRLDESRYRAHDQERLLADSSKITEHTGWGTRYSTAESLKDILTYWKEILSQHQPTTPGSNSTLDVSKRTCVPES